MLKNAPRLSLVPTIVWLFIFVGSLLGLYLEDRVLQDARDTDFNAASGERLDATYIPGRLPGGVMLLAGFGSDQTAMRPAAVEFVRAGLSVFTFDFSGHSRSGGGLGFDNARSSRQAEELLQAQEEFMRLSGLRADQIVYFGHSLGARVALQAAGMSDLPPAGLILLGAQVNLTPNTQAEFFTGISDARLDWVAQLGPRTPATSVFLINGAWDDILTPQAARALQCKLTAGDCVVWRHTGSNLAGTEGEWVSLPDLLCNSPVGDCAVWQRTGSLADGTVREWRLLPALLHNYEPYSPRVLAQAKTWVAESLGLPLDATADTTQLRLILWVSGFAGLLGAVVNGARWMRRREPIQAAPGAFQIVSLRRFLAGKFWLWLPALPLGVLVSGAVFIVPLPKPVLNLYYLAFFGGYGLLFLLLRRLGRIPGLKKITLPPTQSSKPPRLIPAAALLVLALGLSALYANSGWFYVFPLNLRLLWLVLFIPPTSLGFWIGLSESRMLAEQAPGNRWAGILCSVSGLVPFFVYSLILGVLGSLSGLTAAVQGLLILWLILAFGELMSAVSSNDAFTAVAQAMLLYWIILPQGVLFL
jgi:pimeloyl-ACP methyl ester carboxylesterase